MSNEKKNLKDMRTFSQSKKDGLYTEIIKLPIQHTPNYQHIAIKKPHPGARMSAIKMLNKIVDFNLNLNYPTN